MFYGVIHKFDMGKALVSSILDDERNNIKP
jgi:hypothetical protein